MTTGGVIYLSKKAVFVFFGLLFLIFFMRMFYAQYIYIEEALVSENLEKLKAYEKVILFHFPLSPYTKKAVNGMLIECEKFNEEREKLYCYETLRSSLIQIKSFYQPYKNVIESIKTKIAHLRTIEMINWKENRLTMKDYQSLYQQHMKLLEYENAPSVFWSIIVVFSLIGWITNVFIVIIKGLGTPVDKKFLLLGFCGFMIFFTLWIIGLYLA